ncbi:sugar transferase [Lunatibacter salilacus]|uniref:sugar transferase n=1 Tax=Lunatibacter salilacus TaxID=2483804 RepID=UPI00293BD11C|nr:sugar transferase [Lunatibacter salilacus]
MLRRIVDFSVSLIALVVTFPIWIGVALLTLFFHGPPVIFFQVRPGKMGKPFKMLKFRSMANSKGSDGILLSDEQRITEFGSWIRSTSLDEIPSLLNVLKGEMSLIGPRPLLVEYNELYNDFQRKRLSIKPGITGWAQVNGRNAISWDRRFELDVWYVENRSFLLDLKILLKTVKKVFKKEGISHEGNVSMPIWKGNKD